MESTPSFTFQKTEPARRALMGRISFSLGLALVCLVITLVLWFGGIALSSVFNQGRAQTEEAITQTAANWPLPLQQAILAIPQQVSRVKELVDSHVYASRVFDFLSQNTLKTINLTTIDIKVSPPTLRIDGAAPDFDTLASQIVWLHSLPSITNLTLANVVRNEKGKVKFTITLDLSSAFFKSS